MERIAHAKHTVRMKLNEKGRFAPPPKLKGAAAQHVSETIARWEGVHARTHWLLGDEREVDGADFYVGDHEVGHIHLDSEAHIMLPKTVADVLIENRLARPLKWSRSAVVFGVDSANDVDHALWLFRLSFDKGRGVAIPELLHRIAQYAPRTAPIAKEGSPS